MSNPAVIVLDDVSSKKGPFKRFTIEDNIGESIHLHIDNMRVDFTINEFLEFSEMVRKSLKELDILKSYDINKFDEHFLKQCANYLPDLIEIKKEKIKLKYLKAIVHYKFKDLTLQKIVPLNETPAYKYLKGDKYEWINYPQFNYFGVNNEERLLKLKESIEKNGYPYDEKYIVLFNGQNLIRDGQHRAVVLAYLYGFDYEIEVLKFYFKGNKHIYNNSNSKKLLIWFLKKIYRKLKRAVKH
ncbi:hypothetical protein NAMH_1662 [Nautilia profundicola AmH]|uniref:Uncharacterized protein n=1 Tax=Nautilia profundicola (strain ATCC BAA-1463 / DSM 18972 / AmH) TaxID=598659 RepID=B9L6Q4_NAUPA|nr:hypothetical protein [Nautilia profundicola]ACM92873.1 hypothetical protein NAMH_1662 [Nautilia profundicola AmH]